ncbi:MAG: hexapeptide transferase [Bacteroidetes bacterium]|nr:hexapeptide transferase [Bacteroidota bacterium]
MINRFIFFIYYLKELDLKKIRRFQKYVKNNYKKSYLSQTIDAIDSTFRYNISLLDYYYFKFFALKKSERLLYAGTGFMYEYQLKMNPKESRNILENKILFLKAYKTFTNRLSASIEEIKNNKNIAEELLSVHNYLLVLKTAMGQVGAEVEIVSTKDFNYETLLTYMIANNYDLIEQFIIQHDKLMALSPSGLNTIRVITQIKGSEVIIIGARLRISINSHVDNMAAGNAAAPIDLKTGKLFGSAVYSDITKQDFTTHPITGIEIIGFQIPFWKETLEMITKAAAAHPENKSIGWDVAISNDGPQLVEGNHNWCKLLWQLPVKKGLKKELEIFLE